MFLSRFTIGVWLIFPIVISAGMARGQDYPSKPIRIYTGSVGGGTDFLSRSIAQGISGPLGQPVIVDNRPSLTFPELMAKSPPDGYTLLVAGASFWIGPLLQEMHYDVVKDFSPVSLISRDVFILAVHPSLPVKSVKELIALAKSKPGELNYSTTLPGGPQNLGMELLKSMAGVNIVAIQYKGGAQAIAALIGGEVQVTVADIAGLMPSVKSDRLRALAVTSADPTALVPGLPTIASAGLPGYELVGAAGMWAPARTPATVINRLNLEVVRYLNRPEVKERFLNNEQEVIASSPEQFDATIKSDVVKWGKLIKDTQLKN